MTNSKLDRRAQRTREQLQQALTELLAEKTYDSITIQDITERANVGRTTFYAHFHSKDDLYLQGHFAIVARLGHDSLTIDQLLAPDPPAYLVKMFEFLAQDRSRYFDLVQSNDALIFLREVRKHATEIIERCLRDAFQEQPGQVPITVLANYLGGAQLTLVWWWVEARAPINAQELANFYHRLQRAALRDALTLSDTAASGVGMIR